MIKPVCEKSEKAGKRKKVKRKKIENKREKESGGTLTQGPGDTIRSKIEDKLTEVKLKHRESATYPNTPWAPSGLERIEVPAAIPHPALVRICWWARVFAFFQLVHYSFGCQKKGFRW